MRAIVLLCLLHAFGGDARYSWDGPAQTAPPPQPTTADTMCLQDQASCGCCLMQRKIKQLQWYFNQTAEAMNMELAETKRAVNYMRASRSAFSVALTDDKMLKCFGPFNETMSIMYKHVFLNLGDSYDMKTGIFTVPRCGVYSIAVTVYNTAASGSAAIGAELQVNGQAVAMLREKNDSDREDSASVVVALKLMAKDQVTVMLLDGFSVCDNDSHFNTFTGFLLYATD